MGMHTRLYTSVVVLLAAGCSKPDDSDSGMLNALAQIRAVNIPLADGDPVLQPELGVEWELRHNIADSMAPRAFAKLPDGQFRLNAHDFVAHVHPDRLVLNTSTDPEGVTLRIRDHAPSLRLPGAAPRGKDSTLTAWVASDTLHVIWNGIEGRLAWPGPHRVSRVSLGVNAGSLHTRTLQIGPGVSAPSDGADRAGAPRPPSSEPVPGPRSSDRR